MTGHSRGKTTANSRNQRASAARRGWWRGGVIYQAYPRSWSDSNGDGIGDLRGIIDRLDYLEWLGIDGLWLNPLMPSPDHDWGYDVSDYKAIHPAMGTLDDFDELVAQAARRAIKIVFDLVPSHTSDRHAWFLDARSSKSSRYRDYYVWRRPGPRGSLPNNWMSYFGRAAWSFDDGTGEYYMHNFSPHQPQLNWWNAEVREEFDRILNFWLERGIGGVRLDAVQALLYDKQFRDNPLATRDDSDKERRIGQRLKYNANHPDVHRIVRHWHSLTAQFDPQRLLLGETWVPSIRQMVKYYGNGTDEFDLTWNLTFLRSPFASRPLRQIIELTLRLLPDDAWAAWAASTHDDEGRATTRWCGGVPATIRCAMLLLLTLRGTPIIYYGDEIGMTEPLLGKMRRALRDEESGRSRDGSRTPMQWKAAPGAGFTSSTQPWLPLGDASVANVETQSADRGSVLWLVHDLLALRRTFDDLAVGELALVSSPAGTLAWHRGKSAFIAVNLGTTMRRIRTSGQILICTDRTRDQEYVAEWLELRSREAVVVRSTSR
jgi:alpha-glucosidase